MTTVYIQYSTDLACLSPCLLQDALAPYQHIDQDLKSLKEVVEMKNQQIHQQEKKISDLEKVVGSNRPASPQRSQAHMHTVQCVHITLHGCGKWKMVLWFCSAFEQAQKNVLLEEKVQVLQQQNEDLKARIEMNLVLSR